MTVGSRVTIPMSAAALIAVALVVTGAGASYLLLRTRIGNGRQTDPRPAVARADTPPPADHAGAPASTATQSDAVVSLTADAMARAGIVVAPVSTGESTPEIRVPGVVQPNAYRQVQVTPLVAGRVTAVSAELGAHVRRGQTLAQIYSPELAEAQTKYVSARAMLDAHDRELQRTHRLVEIGAASRQELERIHAEHAAQTAALQSARSQLELLGVRASAIEALGSSSHVNATTRVPAPLDGVVTERAANVGVNVDPATKLFTVVDLSTVWIVADVYEKDLSLVRVGSEAVIAATAYPGQSQRGRVSYIDPQVSAETRTARIRVEVPNPRGDLRLGMYVDVLLTVAGPVSVTVVPRTAVQNVGDRAVVYLANTKEPGKFTEREVRLGEASGQQVHVESGLEPGDVVVTEGSFFIRAERERLGLRATTAAPGVQTARVLVNEQGFDPAKVAVRARVRTRLTFLRTTDKTCATEVVFPSLNITQALPLNKPVEIAFTPAQSGEIAFSCGMNMFGGAVVVQ